MPQTGQLTHSQFANVPRATREACDDSGVHQSLGSEDLALTGWDVLAVGLQQAWPFMTFAAPTDERTERTLWIDTDFSATDEFGSSVAGSPFAVLERFVML